MNSDPLSYDISVSLGYLVVRIPVSSPYIEVRMNTSRPYAIVKARTDTYGIYTPT